MSQTVNTDVNVLVQLTLTDTDAKVMLVVRQGDRISNFYKFEESYERRWETVEFEEGNTVIMNEFDDIMCNSERLERLSTTNPYNVIVETLDSLVTWRAIDPNENKLINQLLRNVNNVNLGSDVWLNGWFSDGGQYGKYEINYTFKD